MKFRVDPELGKRIVLLSAPVVLAMLCQTAINVVDQALIGRLPASDSVPGQAALGPALNIFWAIGGFLSAISVGTQALTARRTGEQGHEQAGKVLVNSLIVALISSFLFTIIGWFSAGRLFRMVNSNPDVLRLGVPYLRWRLLGVTSMVAAFSYKSWFDGLGKTHVHMVAAILMNVLNFFLNLALIFGKWGCPALGVEGSAIASMISSYIGLFLMAFWSLGRKYTRTHRHYRLSNVSLRQQWELVKLSLPSGIATAFVMSGFALFYRIVGMLDAQAGSESLYTAATQNVIVLLIAVFSGSIAYGTAVATLVGQSLGAKLPELAERYGWEAVKLGFYVTACIGCLISIYPEVVLHLLTKHEAVVVVGTPLLRICGALLPFILTGITLTQALFGAGNTRFVMFVEFGLHFGCLVPVAYVCGVVLHLGVIGVWSGAFIYILLLASIMAWKFASGTWKTIQI